MERHSSLALLFLIGLLLSSAHAQVTNPQGNGQDYFTADKRGGSYLAIVEANHVRTIPDWIKEGRLNGAIADIKYTLDRFPNHPVSLQQLSMVGQMTKNYALPTSYFERAVALFPQYALTRAQYGWFLMSTNNIDAAIENLKQSIEMEPKLSAGYAGLAHVYAKKGDFEHAREAAQKARELGFNGKLPDGL
jgi:tetratricopeptide (TPR) repeat protein